MTIQDFKNFIAKNKIKKVLVSTGDRTYIENNHLILNKYDSEDLSNLFYRLDSLEEVDLSNFDFTNTVTMSSCFYGCTNLKKIIFPKLVYCPNLCYLIRCFVGTSIKTIDFSNWTFEATNIHFDGCFKHCDNLTKLTMPKAKNLFVFDLCYACRDLKEIVFNQCNLCLGTKGTSVNTAFYGCQNLKLINCAELQGDSDFIAIMLASMANNAQIPDDCVIVLPN